MKPLAKRIVGGVAALFAAAIIWLWCLHVWFTKPANHFRSMEGLSPVARRIFPTTHE